jgi:DNA-directed RNA polymerase specialized sigma24 family protein
VRVDRADEDRFREFVAHRSATLLRTAYLLVDRAEQAEDLVQTALVRTYQAWHRIRDVDSVEGFTRRAMARIAIPWWRGGLTRPFGEDSPHDWH